MSTVLTAHIGHKTTPRADYELRCLTCDMTLLLPRTVTPTAPSRWRAPEGSCSDPKQNAAWILLRQRLGGQR